MNDNLRMVANNLADTATVVASTVASAALAAANLQLPDRADYWRGLPGKYQVLSASWGTPVTLDSVGLAFSNLSGTATMRVRASNEAAATNLLGVNSDRFELYGNPPASTRYVLGPDNQLSGVVPITDSTSDRWEISIPANAYPNGTVLTLSWFQKTVPTNGTTGQVFNPVSWVGATAGTLNTVTGYPNGYSRKWLTATITDTANAQALRLYMQGTVGASDLAACCWQLELGSAPTSYYPSAATFTSRASSGTYLDANGKIATAATNIARMNYQYPSVGTVAPRLLVEAASTNELLYSEQLDNAQWQKGQATIVANAAGAPDAPDGTHTMDKIVCSVSGATGHYVYQPRGSYVAGDLVTISIFAAKAEYGMICLGISQGGAFPVTAYYVTFDLSTGAFVASVGSPAGYTATQYPNGVWRFSVTQVATASGSCTAIFIAADSTGGGTNKYNIVGDGVSGIYMWGGQIEKGSAPTSYIQTPAAVAVTRAADVATYAPATRAAGYMDWWQPYSFDSGDIACCPGGGAELWQWGKTPIGANGVAYGGGVHARQYLTTPVSALRVMVRISDPDNTQGYLEAARLVLGKYWETTSALAYGAGTEPLDTTKNYRSEAGQLCSDVGTRSRKVTVDLTSMDANDRSALWDILWANGMSVPVWFSLYPNNSDGKLEQNNMVLGKLMQMGSMKSPTYRRFANTIVIEEI